MDQLHSNTDDNSRKRGMHLSLDERGAIQILNRQGLSLRAIADTVGCAHATVWYELRRGTPQRTSSRGRIPIYMAKRGQTVYNEHRTHCRKPCKLDNDLFKPFIRWLVKQVREKHWSLDICVGYAKLHHLFPTEEMVCTKTLYNMLWAGKLPITLFEVPCVLSRKQHRKWNRKNKRMLGRSIDERPAIVDEQEELGHWEADTVVGKRQGKESVVFTMVERITNHYIAIKIPGRNSAGVSQAMAQLHEQYGDRFAQVFKTITADNGPEFETFSAAESWGTKVYFAHPYSSWERPHNERHNGMLREYIPKGNSIEQYSDEEILSFADELNSRPRRVLGYHRPDDLFETFLDKVYVC
jgi:transposase, IS30 family